LDAEIWLPERAFAIWDVSTRDWRVPAGDYRIMIGSSSRELECGGTVSA
jgi:hypothetical protein